MGVSKNRGTLKSSISIGFSIINHPFWAIYLYFWKHPHVEGFFVKRKHGPGSSIRDPNLGVLSDLFRGENVTSIWGNKRPLGRSWEKVLFVVNFLGEEKGDVQRLSCSF